MIAADIMTENPRTVRQTDSISEAVDALQSMDVRHLPVVDDDDNLVGMLSERDLAPVMKPFFGGDVDRMMPGLAQRRVVDFMSADVATVEPDADVSTVIETMLEQRVGALPVVDGEGAVIGIVSYVDVLRAFGSPGEPLGPPHRTTSVAR